MTRRRILHGTLIGIVATLSGLAACSGNGQSDIRSTCFDPLVPGTVTFMPSLDVVITDRRGHGQALGTTVTTTGTAALVRVDRPDSLHAILGNQSGTFDVHVSKPFYQDATVSGVVVPAAECGGPITTTVPVTLDLAPGAPALRSVGILGARFLPNPGDKDTLVAYFDADLDVPRGVIWRVSDPALAAISPDGIVTVKCVPGGGTETVTVLAAADTTVRGIARMSVSAVTTCPP